mmetsp:Transcript_54167/g.126050  ORF Transcript_54167/g.126050 Transcript_54167/m.126050 type:complete len:211 (-) Transcript_54167:437-1069(-)
MHMARVPRHHSKYARGIASRRSMTCGIWKMTELPVCAVSSESLTMPRQAARKMSSSWAPIWQPKFAASRWASAKVHCPSPSRSSRSQAPSIAVLGGMHDRTPPTLLQIAAVAGGTSSSSAASSSSARDLPLPEGLPDAMKLASFRTLPQVLALTWETGLATVVEEQHLFKPEHCAPMQHSSVVIASWSSASSIRVCLKVRLTFSSNCWLS